MKKDQQSQQVNDPLPLGPMPETMALAVFDGAKHNTPTKQLRLTYAQLTDLLANRRRAGAKDGKAVVFAELNGPRANSNVVGVSALGVDKDKDGGVQQMAELMRAAGLAGAIYETHSSTPENPKCRAVVPYVEPITGAEHQRIAKHFAAMWSGDAACTDAARLFYLPSSPTAEAAAAAKGAVVEGLALDGKALAAQLAADSFELPAGASARKLAAINADLSANLPTGPSLVPDVAALPDVLAHLDPDCDRKTWWKVLAALSKEFGDAARDAALHWSMQGELFDRDEFDYQWRDSIARAKDGRADNGAGLGTVIDMARQGGWKPKPSASPAAPELDIDVRAVVGETFGDIANGKVLAALTGGNLQYAPGVGFVAYSAAYGHRKLHEGGELAWAKQIPTVYSRYAARMAAEHPDQAAKIKQHAIASSKLNRLTAAVELLKTEPGVTVAPENVDARGPIVAARNGLVNIKTGEFRPFDRGVVALRRLGVEFDAAATAPKFSNEFLPNLIPDQERRDALQMLLGASLAGERVGERLELLYGARGGEGKSTLVQLIRRIFGTYAAVLPGSVLLESYSQGKGHTAELFSAIGARLFVFGEIDERARICASTVKAFNGGDPMLLRNTFGTSCVTYEFIGLCMMPVNDLPDLNANDGGLKRRIKVWVFYRVQEKPKPGFGHRLFVDEGSGILNWLIEGAAKFARGEYREPAAVVADSAGYLTDHDTIQHWLADHTTKGGPTEGDVLYRAYRAWALNNGHQPVSKSKLGRRIGAKGIARCKTSAGTVAYELGLSDKGKRAAGVF